MIAHAIRVIKPVSVGIAVAEVNTDVLYVMVQAAKGSIVIIIRSNVQVVMGLEIFPAVPVPEVVNAELVTAEAKYHAV